LRLSALGWDIPFFAQFGRLIIGEAVGITATLEFGNRMKQILKAIIEAGVRPEMPVRKARFVKACNLIAIISALWLIGILPMFTQYLPATRVVMFTTAACALGLCFYRSAQSFAPTITMPTVAFNALYFGHQA
jgi:hypothetical protein